MSRSRRTMAWGLVILLISFSAARAQEIVEVAEPLARDDDAAVADLKAGLTFSEAMARYTGI